MRSVSGREFCKVLERHGWEVLRVQGSHHIYGKAGERARLSVPVHGNPPLKAGLQRHLMNLAKLTEADL